MMHVSLLFLLLVTADRSSGQKVCSYQEVLDHLNFTRYNELYTLTRPVLDHTHLTVVNLDIILYAILAVIEKTQTFIPFIWVLMTWNNEFISWDPSLFCGITQVSVPKDMLWRPDLFIYEMTERDEAPHSPYVYVSHDGTVTVEDDLRVVSTCKMDVHKFPFDTQSCNITVGSAIHCVDEMRLVPFSNSSRATQFSRQVMQRQGEWDFIQLSVTNDTLSCEERGDMERLIYTITMKRRPLLHVINFLLPILFFLCLDLSSFLISDHRGEKLGFKVTVLLAISVLLLILNDILPSMSNRTPLIATYCIVIFALMLLSLLETVLVTYLMEKDAVPLETGTDEDEDRSLKADCHCQDKQDKEDTVLGCDRDGRRSELPAYCDVTGDDTTCELLSITAQVSDVAQRGGGGGESQVLEQQILERLRELENTLSGFLRGSKGGGWQKPGGYWNRVATRINAAFFMFYCVTVALFLILMYVEWS